MEEGTRRFSVALCQGKQPQQLQQQTYFLILKKRIINMREVAFNALGRISFPSLNKTIYQTLCEP